VRKLIDDNNLNASLIPATGPGGRLTKGDVIAFMERPRAGASVAAAPAAPAMALAALPPRPEDPREERVKMTKLRRIIAQRLKEAQNTAAMLTTYNEVDMTTAMDVRNQFREVFEKKHGTRLGFMSFFVRAAVTALKEWPAVNAEIYGDEIVYKNYYHIGVAVGSPQGLVVPVIKDADRMSFAEIETKIADFGRRARDGKLTIAEMTGGTFTISNGGVYGSLLSMPILNPPQSGIMGMHKIEKRPRAIGDRIEIRPMMYVALTYDHRIIDGREAVSFLTRVKELVEDPQRILIDV
jgi:2-oxoglutarate dehydrogenase E2 component (dihydrolipoamide succinyltransferase)